MAEYKGRKVTLNKPRRIAKGEPSYGKKKTMVYVMDKGKVKKITFGDPKMRIKRHHLLEENRLEQGIIVILPTIRQQLGIGLVRLGKWQN